jgi:Bacteriophage Sf6, terminase small subunit-like
MRTIRTPQKRTAFLAELAAGGSVQRACLAARIGRSAAYAWRENDEDFAAAWEDAYEAGTDRLEDELTRRALDGSDTCLIFALKSPVYRCESEGGQMMSLCAGHLRLRN